MGHPEKEEVLVSDPESRIAATFSSPSNRHGFPPKFVDGEVFARTIDPWLLRKPSPWFDPPFDPVDLQKFDFSLEDVLFRQLLRMPPAVSHPPEGPVPALLSVEDFVYAGVKSLWEVFWGRDKPLPFSVYRPAESAVSGGVAVPGAVVVTPANSDQVLLLALLRPDIRDGGSAARPPVPLLRESLFYAVRLLLERSAAAPTDAFFVLLFDCRYGGVVRVEGDMEKLRSQAAAAEWVMNQAGITVSSVEKVWNELGNPNWGDKGALHALMAAFHSIVQFSGAPLHSVDDLAADHSSRIQERMAERGLGGDRGALVELPEEPPAGVLEVGSLVWAEGSDWKKGYRVEKVVVGGGGAPSYVATPVGGHGAAVFLHMGPRLTHAGPADMGLWYKVQRQAKVLEVLARRGISSRNLPELCGYGRVVDPGRCGTLVLVTAPVGETVADMAGGGRFGREEVLRCCHDLLSALEAAASVGVRHGDVCPEKALFVGSGEGGYFLLDGWGRAVVEERDRPAMNLHYSSTYALQEGRLCPSSDAESLVYLLYYSAGGHLPEVDSVEAALQWRETSWSRRTIQGVLGEASLLLKAFADYVNSLCGTPYPVDYEIWLRRLKRSSTPDEHGKVRC